jgi:hypothetical protein
MRRGSTFTYLHDSAAQAVRAFALRRAAAASQPATTLWRRLLCVFRRSHHDLVRQADGQLFLECTRCRRRTQGWTLIGAPRRPPATALRLLLDESADVAGAGFAERPGGHQRWLDWERRTEITLEV